MCCYIVYLEMSQYPIDSNDQALKKKKKLSYNNKN